MEASLNDVSKSHSVVSLVAGETPGQLVLSGLWNELEQLIYHGKINAQAWREFGTGRSLLHLAAASNQVEVISYLVKEAKLSINLQDEDGNTPLHLAVVNGHTEAVNVILGHRPDDSIRNKEEEPALHLAVQQGNGVFGAFIDHPKVNLFVKGVRDYSVAHIIVKNNNVEALKLLYTKLEDWSEQLRHLMRQKDKNGLSILHTAAQAGANDILDSIISTCKVHFSNPKELLCCVTREKRTPMDYAVEFKRLKCVDVLLKHGYDPTHTRSCHPSSLFLVCMHGYMDALRLMVDTCGAGILKSRNSQGMTVLHISTSSVNSRALISYLVESGCSMDEVDGEGFTALARAVEMGSVSAVAELLRLGADPLVKDKKGHNALHRAVVGKRNAIFKAIMCSSSAGTLASSPDNEGNYPIHLALALGVPEMVVPLMDIAKEHVHDKKENNYMHLAALSRNEQSLTSLLSCPCAAHMVNGANCEGLTPLHYAAMGSSISAVQKLTDYGAMVHQSNSGLTPLMAACCCGNLEAAKFLCRSSKFQVDWRDHNGRTALHLAVSSSQPQMITFCLDEDMAVTLDCDRLSFLDLILDGCEQGLAQAVVNHKRWMECIDGCSPDKPHPILRILDQMPDVYRTILDNCFSKSSFNPTHHDYWEEFNFKCLDLQPLPSDEASDATTTVEMTDKGSSTSQLLSEVVEHRGCAQERPRRRRILSLFRRRSKNQVDSLTVIHKLMKHGHSSYLPHPVVSAYVKMKWKGLGMLVYMGALLMRLLLAVFFSIFVSVIPLPSQSVDSMSASVNVSNSTSELSSDSISTSMFVLLCISLVLAIVNLITFLIHIYDLGPRIVLNFQSGLREWSGFVASASIIIFLLSVLVSGLESSLWNAAAVGVFFAWTSCNFMLQLMDLLNFGIYITMMVSTLKLVIHVAVIFLLFILSFTFAFYILVGTVEELHYSTLGLSFYATFLTVIDAADFVAFANLQQAEQFRFPVVVFALLACVIVLLPVVFINVLIGLAVGDIAAIQKKAVLSRLTAKVEALAGLDNNYKRLILKLWRGRIFKKHLKYYPNRLHYRSILAKLFRLDDNTTSRDSSGSVELKQVRQELQLCRQNLYKVQEEVRSLTSSQAGLLDGVSRLEGMVAKLVAQ